MTDYSKLLSVVPTNDLSPMLQSFHFYEDRVQATNTRVVYDVPSDIGLRSNVKAQEFVKAMSILSEKFKVLPETNAFVFKDSQYSIKVPLVVDEFPKKDPPEVKSSHLLLEPGIEESFRLIKPFIGADLSRIFTMSILFKESWAYACSFAVLAGVRVDKYLNPKLQDFNLPIYGLETILSHPSPISAIIPPKGDEGVYVVFEDSAWIWCSSLNTDYPNYPKMISSIDPKTLSPLPKGFSKAVQDMNTISMMNPYCKTEITFSEKGIETAEGECYALAKVGEWKRSKYNGNLMSTVAAVATKMNLDLYPAPVPWSNDDGSVKGLITGMVVEEKKEEKKDG